ncbi:MAG: 50S ribosomal protein L11 methyltransferase [Betaproteobacteria bacterium]|jgi:ribosomal protein L11 methyltransferase|nr:MAG: 50S ribosomal protein L11 methyltransferase [Betaproteobacteria bacterium]
MPWVAAELLLEAPVVNPFADALLELGAISVDIADARSGREDEQAIYMEPGEDVTVAWGDNRIVALFQESADVKCAVKEAASFVGLANVPSYRTYPVAEQDWVRTTQRQFEPIAVSQRLWVVPSWYAAPEPDAVNIVLDPGLAFGTGTHPTTFLCMDWLDRNLERGQSVIDYGCGSGILAITAARLGALTVTGVDIDAQAVQTSRYNAERNGVQVRFVGTEASDIGAADVVLANILSGPLKVLAPLLSGLTRIGGRLVLSGILEWQAEELRSLYRPWFEALSAVTREGWVRLEGIRRKD